MEMREERKAVVEAADEAAGITLRFSSSSSVKSSDSHESLLL